MKTKALLTTVLAGSIAQLVHASTFNSILTGNWSDPNSWDGGGSIPDTYFLDSAVVTGGTIIDYDGLLSGSSSAPAGLAMEAGGLWVSDGNSLTVDAGTLTQSTLAAEIRIGEGDSPSGVLGTLTIDNGGVFNTGASIGMLVGSSLTMDGAGVPVSLGNGEVDVKDGSLIMGAGAAAGGLGVGTNGSTGVFNLGDGSGAAGSAILDLATNNVQLGVGVQVPGTASPVGGIGTFTINSDGILNLGTNGISVGYGASGNGTLTVNGGGQIVGLGAGGGSIVVGDAGATGNLNILPGAVVTNSGELRIGSNGGTGTMTMTGGNVNTTGAEFNIGRGAGATGTANISDGSIVAGHTFIGRDGGNGLLSVTATANVDVGQMYIGNNGTGTVNVNGGGTMVNHDWSELGTNPGSVGNLNIDGPTSKYIHIEEAGDMEVGYQGGTANINVTNGGKLVNNWWFNMARGAGSTANVLIDGVGSTIDMSNSDDPGGGRNSRTNVGEDGTGTLTVQNGGQFYNTELWVGRNGGSNGTLNILSGGTTTTDQWLVVGGGGGTGVINIDGAGSNLTHYGVIGGRNGGGGGDNEIGYAGGNGTINITNGGRFETGWWMNIARGAGSTGNVNIDGPTSVMDVGGPSDRSNGDAKTNIGEDGVGTMTLTNGATLLNSRVGAAGGHELIIGRNGGSVGTLNILSGSQVLSSGNWSTVVGNDGNGTVNVAGAGKLLADNWIVIGNNSDATGTVNIQDDGSYIQSGTPAGPNHEGRLIVGRQGIGTLNQSGGTVEADNWLAIGIDGEGNGNPHGQGTYNFSGGQILLSQPNFGDRQVVVGDFGTGTLNITNAKPDGSSIQSSINDPTFGTSINYFNVAGDSGGIGTLNINLSDPTGVVRSRELYAGWSSNPALISNGTINVTSGHLITDGWVELGRGGDGAGGIGTVNIDGPNSVWDRGTLAPNTGDGSLGARDINVGQGSGLNTGEGFINVTNGGTLNTNWWIDLARQSGTKGHLLIDGAGSTVNMVDAHTHGLGGDGNSQFNVGESGLGTLIITNGGVFNHNMDHGGGELYIARNTGAIGTATIDGAGSALNSHAREFRIAESDASNGVLNITNGGAVNFSSVDENGNQVDGNFLIAENGTANGTINMDHGSLTVDAWGFDAAWQDGADNSVATINAVNSTIDIVNGTGNHGRLLWGRRGTATINQQGGTVNVANWAVIGVEVGGRGYYNLTGSAEGPGVVNFNSANNTDGLNIGRGGSTGVVDVGPGGTMNVANSWTTVGGRDGAGNGTLNVHDGGVFNSISGAGGTDFLIGWNTGSTGAVNVTNGGTVNYNWWVRTGIDPGSTGSILVDNNSVFNQNTGRVNIGENGTGSLTITNNSSYIHTNADQFNVGGGDDGGNNSGLGTLTIDATSLLSTSNFIRVGHGVVGGVPATGIVNLNGGVINAGNWMGFGHEGGDGTLNMSGGLITVTGQFYVGVDDNGHTRSSTGTANISGGTINAGDFIHIGRNGGIGVMNVTGTNPVSLNSANNFYVGQGGLGAGGSVGTGTLNFDNPNATITVVNGFYVGQDGGLGTVNQSAGTITESNQWVTLAGGAGGGTGSYNISGGRLNANVLEVGADANGFLNISGTGEVVANFMTIGTRTTGVGTVNVSGGLLQVADHINLGGDQGDGAGNYAASETGTMNLTGGVVAAGYLKSYHPNGSTVALNMDGGTLRALGDNGDFLQGFGPDDSEVLAGGVIFDTNGHNITVNNQFDGVGGLTKIGDGNLTVANPANLNTGGTVINRGNVIYPVISAAGAGGPVDIQINAPGAAALDGSDLNPLLARTIATSNGAIALHNNNSGADLDFTTYPNLSLGSVGDSTFSNNLTPGGGNFRLGGGGGNLTFTTAMADVGGPTGLIIDGNGLTGNVILTAQSTYTGPTNIAGGTLTLSGGPDVLPNCTTLTIGATGALELNGVTQQIGSLAGPAGALLDNSASAVNFTLGCDNTNTVYGGLITGNVSVVKIGTGTQTISAPQTYSGLTVNQGEVVLGGTNHLGNLSLANGTFVQLSSHTGGPGNVKVIDTNTLSLTGSAKLDLTNNAMVIHTGSYATFHSAVVSGFNGGGWDGPGINSSAAATDPNGRTAIGIIDNSVAGFTDFAGVSGLTGTETILKYTYYGDADLSGTVTADDFSLFLSGYTGASPADWIFGDFDYSGSVTADDFSLFLDTYTSNGPALRDPVLAGELNAFAQGLAGGDAASDPGATAGGDAGLAGRAVVPEPGSIGLLAVGALGLLARRRRANPRQ